MHEYDTLKEKQLDDEINRDNEDAEKASRTKKIIITVDEKYESISIDFTKEVKVADLIRVAKGLILVISENSEFTPEETAKALLKYVKEDN